MRLFDNEGLATSGSASFAEPTFSYLNRSTRPIFQFIREFLEEWFTRYPAADKPDLRARFKSKSNQQHNSAFFELLLHELLLSLGCNVDIHPILEASTRSPDFRVQIGGKTLFYLEATVAAYQSDEEAAAQARLNELYDVLNRHVDATNFFIWVEISSGPKVPPPARKIASFLNSRLQETDPDEVALTYENEGYEAAPLWPFSDQGWSILFRPIPKRPDARGRPGVQPLGMFSGSLIQVDHRTPLREAISSKATAYGELGEPFIVATNALEMIDEIDVMEALFGKEQFTVYFSQDPSDDSVITEPSRIPDGLWTSPSGPINTRLSAVIIANRLRAWSIGEASVRLYHNPWASLPYQSQLTRLPQAVPDHGKYKYVDGDTLVEILGLKWPSDLAG